MRGGGSVLSYANRFKQTPDESDGTRKFKRVSSLTTDYNFLSPTNSSTNEKNHSMCESYDNNNAGLPKETIGHDDVFSQKSPDELKGNTQGQLYRPQKQTAALPSDENELNPNMETTSGSSPTNKITKSWEEGIRTDECQSNYIPKRKHRLGKFTSQEPYTESPPFNQVSPLNDHNREEITSCHKSMPTETTFSHVQTSRSSDDVTPLVQSKVTIEVSSGKKANDHDPTTCFLKESFVVYV